MNADMECFWPHNRIVIVICAICVMRGQDNRLSRFLSNRPDNQHPRISSGWQAFFISKLLQFIYNLRFQPQRHNLFFGPHKHNVFCIFFWSPNRLFVM